MSESKYWVYILLCENGSYYTGYTNDLEKRYALHLAGKASKYTRSFKPLRIAASWACDSMQMARKREAQIKQLSRKNKDRLVASPALIGVLCVEC